MKKGLLTNIAYTNGLWAAGVVVLILSAIHDSFFPFRDIRIQHNHIVEAFGGISIFSFSIKTLMQNVYVNNIFRLFSLLGSALLLQYISSEFRLIRVRSFFPFFFFCIFSATVLPFLPMTGVSFSCIFFCWACIRLFRAFDTDYPHRAVFDASVLLSIASVFQIRLLYLAPVIWLIMMIFRVLTFRSFLSSLLGLLSVFWIIGGLSFIFGDYFFLKVVLNGMTSFELVSFAGMSPSEAAYLFFLGILMISALISFWPRQHLDKLLTRNYLNSMILLWFALLALWLFSGNDLEFLLYLYSLSALMVAHFFSLVDTLYSRTMFFLFLLLSVLVYFFF